MQSLAGLITLMTGAVLVVWAAKALRQPYPLLLVPAGIVFGMIPGLSTIKIDPSLILATVLPPILYYAAYSLPLAQFRRHGIQITALSLGLVLASTITIGLVAKLAIPGLPWAAGFAVGAILAPPDSVAASAILKRFPIGERLSAILEGESLLNDAAGLVFYRFAVAALVTGSFAPMDAVGELGVVALTGAFIGTAAGFATKWVSTRMNDAILPIVLSFFVPYAVYLVCEIWHVSGVLGVVAAGLVGAADLKNQSARQRVVGWAVWDILLIAMNCFVFVLIGAELANIGVRGVEAPITDIVLAVLAVFLTMIFVRIAWTVASCGLQRLIASENAPSAGESVVMGWAGMRGIVSLAAALALPEAIPGRDLVLVVVLAVILLSLIVPGLTLPLLIQAVLPSAVDQANDQRRAALQALEDAAAMELASMDAAALPPGVHRALFGYFSVRMEVERLRLDYSSELEAARARIFAAQSNRITALWREGLISQEIKQEIEAELDAAAARTARAGL